jgi:hypothetical protein
LGDDHYIHPRTLHYGNYGGYGGYHHYGDYGYYGEECEDEYNGHHPMEQMYYRVIEEINPDRADVHEVTAFVLKGLVDLYPDFE